MLSFCAADRNISHHSTDLTASNIMSTAVKNHDFHIYLLTQRLLTMCYRMKNSYKIIHNMITSVFVCLYMFMCVLSLQTNLSHHDYTHTNILKKYTPKS